MNLRKYVFFSFVLAIVLSATESHALSSAQQGIYDLVSLQKEVAKKTLDSAALQKQLSKISTVFFPEEIRKELSRLVDNVITKEKNKSPLSCEAKLALSSFISDIQTETFDSLDVSMAYFPKTLHQIGVSKGQDGKSSSQHK